MSRPAEARLTALRLVGFKSFAERTVVEFGPGISAVVGPNGSGKSNLADALRWTLGEAGRSLRTKRAEDVIFAGSSARRAISMADVTLVIDNHDRLLPVDYGEIELGRRLYRSGENEYLINRQRVRLRDVVELLDAGNLADNAFLFIGQGMVDQALALRPEERRPLFEEAAGVRRHERRRRHAEAELAEAEGNLERLRDLLGELRPQARRLAAQAEQLQARRTAGLELAEALVAAARTRWVGSSRAAASEQASLDAAHAQADAALAELRAAEEDAERLSRSLDERADVERAQRTELERLNAATLEMRLRRERLLSDLGAIERDRARLTQERQAIEQRTVDARRLLVRHPDVAAEDAADTAAEQALAEAQRAVADAERALAAAPGSGLEAADPAQARLAEARTARAELERQLQSRQVLVDRLADARARATAAEPVLARAVAERDAAVQRVRDAAESESDAEAAADAARATLESSLARHSERARALAEIDARRAADQARAEALETALGAAVDEQLRRAARARGGSLAAEGLEVEPRFRQAVAAALGDAARALAVDRDTAVVLASGRGVLLLTETETSAGRGPRAAGARAERAAGAAAVEAAAAELEGGLLAIAVRRDPLGHVTRLLGRVCWAPDLPRALDLRASLPAGWSVATLAGELVREDGLVRLGGGDLFLDQRARREELGRGIAELDARHEAAASELAAASADRDAAKAAWEKARAELDGRRREHRLAAEAERPAQRRAEGLIREAEWQAAAVERLAAELAELDSRTAETGSALARLDAAAPDPDAGDDGLRRAAEQHLSELRARRDRLAAAHAARSAERRTAEESRRRAEITLAIDETRAADLDAEAAQLAGREAELSTARDRIAVELAAAEEQAARARSNLDDLLRAGSDDRGSLQRAEKAAFEARERLRAAETRSRAAEVAAMEARLHLEGVREQLLVELAGIGPDGLAALLREAGREAETETDLSPEILGAQLESALDAALALWQGAPPDEEQPAASRLAALRRRFHEVGAGNPFAAQEHAEVSQRLEALEAQRQDLEKAIAGTRDLIASLTAMITEQFRTTFAALEGAFAKRFRQLFDGGEAQLSLTAPEDLSSTGVEITARPPGKKRQPLQMLSGGERALTAVALLLAMLEVRPVPFCVLDEVDAALDEANINRFAAALRGLADRTQFIVITHNRGTIEAADALYGVTVGDDAVSRVVSLRLPSANGAGPMDEAGLREVVSGGA